MKIRYWSTTVGYGREPEDISYWLVAYQFPVKYYVYWKLREKLAWAGCRHIFNRSERLHSWWVDHMELPATLALEVRNVHHSVRLTEQEYLIFR